MTREQSWQVEGTTLTLLCHITPMGFTVSVFRLPRSLYGTSMAALEMRAVDLSKEPPAQHVARVGEVEGGDLFYRCACLLGGDDRHRSGGWWKGASKMPARGRANRLHL